MFLPFEQNIRPKKWLQYEQEDTIVFYLTCFFMACPFNVDEFCVAKEADAGKKRVVKKLQSQGNRIKQLLFTERCTM